MTQVALVFGTFSWIVYGTLGFSAFCSILIHLKHLWDSSRPIPSILAWVEEFEQQELPLYIQLLDENDPLAGDVRDEIRKLQFVTPICTFQLRSVQGRDRGLSTPWESKLERDTATASAWRTVGKIKELISVVETTVLTGIRGDRSQSTASNVVDGKVPGNVGLGGGVPGSVGPGDGTLSGSVQVAKK